MPRCECPILRVPRFRATDSSYRTSTAFRCWVLASCYTGSFQTRYSYLLTKEVSSHSRFLGFILMVNSLFINRNQLGYWSQSERVSGTSQTAAFGVSAESVVALGYSPPAILTLFIVCIALMALPLIFSMRKLKGNMVAGGYNSLVLSAACHAITRSARNARSASTKEAPPESPDHGGRVENLTDAGILII
jgi:hypothetical protein